MPKTLGDLIYGKPGLAVQAAWMKFAAHANACDSCSQVAHACRQPGMQSEHFPPLLEFLCDEGRPSFEAWRYSVDELRSIWRIGF